MTGIVDGIEETKMLQDKYSHTGLLLPRVTGLEAEMKHSILHRVVLAAFDCFVPPVSKAHQSATSRDTAEEPCVGYSEKITKIDEACLKGKDKKKISCHGRVDCIYGTGYLTSQCAM